jgi:uncharacterized protein VirK/YbjX
MTFFSKLPFRFLFSTSTTITRNVVQRRSFFKWQTWHRGALLIFNIRSHLRLIRVLSHPQTARLVTRQPDLSHKYLRNYISFDISTRNCLAILIGHYAYLQENFRGDFLDILCESPPPLWRQSIDGVPFEIALDFPHQIDFEGDLCVIFKKGHCSLYRIIFVIANGGSFGLSDDNVIFISSVHGMHDFDGVKQAAKICHDIQPAQLLMAAVGGIGAALGFHTIIGIGAKNQSSQGEKLFFHTTSSLKTTACSPPGKIFTGFRSPMPKNRWIQSLPGTASGRRESVSSKMKSGSRWRRRSSGIFSESPLYDASACVAAPDPISRRRPPFFSSIHAG